MEVTSFLGADTMSLALILELVSCAVMTGLILIIQFLHYPAFNYIQEETFIQFHQNHTKNISYIVIPTMVLELICAIVLLLTWLDPIFFSVNLVLLALTWCCTFFLSVPAHNLLSKKQDTLAISSLIHTNWPRTFLWSARLVALTVYIGRSLT